MSGQVCKAAICAEYTQAVRTSVDLIFLGHVSDEGIDEFIKLIEPMEGKVKAWQEKYVLIEG